MKKEIPVPVVVVAIVVVLGGIFALLWSKTNEPEGAGDINKIAAEIKSTRTDLPVDPPDVAAGDAMMRGGTRKSKPKKE